MKKYQVKDYDGGQAVIFDNTILAVFFGRSAYEDASKHRNRLLRRDLSKQPRKRNDTASTNAN